MKLDSEMSLLLKTLPERKRRSFLRYMKKGKKKDKVGEDIKESDEEGDDESDSDSDGAEKPEGEEGEALKEETIPYTKDELLKKLEELKLALASDDVDDFDDDDFFGSDLDDEDDSEEGEEEEEDVSEDEEDEKNVKGVTFAKGVKK